MKHFIVRTHRLITSAAIGLYLLIIFYSAETVSAQPCFTTFVPDLPLITASGSIRIEIDAVYDSAKALLLATAPPSAAALNSAISSYNGLNISVNGSTITGTAITSYNQVSFIGTFADHLKFNPGDTAILSKASNTIWWTYVNCCNGTLAGDYAGYTFRNFGRKAVFCAAASDSASKSRFLYIVEKNSSNWNNFWTASYDSIAQLTNGEINTDFIYNNVDMLVPLCKSFDGYDEQYRYLLTLRRYITRFVTVNTNGTNDGAKPDGCGFHHDSNYEAYMYCYNTVVKAMQPVGSTSFQVDASAYSSFRDLVMHKYLLSNEQGYYPLCMAGRSGDWETNTFSQSSLNTLAILGGQILGLATADPVLAGMYNQLYGVNPAFNYAQATPFVTGFYQMNHANAGIFRVRNCVVVNKGFNDQLWGAEGYSTENRYGRYQGYGALAVTYPGSAIVNGFSKSAWDWNHNPGATTKVLAWSELLAGWNRIDEYSSKRLAGSLAFDRRNPGYLDRVTGTYGMFAMDFQERRNLGFSGVTNTDTHDTSFVFKKSNFFFDDVIICLAGGISNTDITHPTVTTLYQQVTSPGNVTVNNAVYTTVGSTTTFSGVSDNWVLDNSGTGYYIVAGSGDLLVQRKDQQTPSPTQTNPSILNPLTQAAIGYLNHGTAPSNAGYEYVTVPNTNSASMQALANSFQNPATKPYSLISKTGNAHIIRHAATGIYGLALFTPNSTVPGGTNISANDRPCLVMYRPDATNTQMKLSLSNPDLGLLGPRSSDIYNYQTVRITFNGNWQPVSPHPSIILVSSGPTSSVYDFVTYQGLPIEADFEIFNITDVADNTKTGSIALFPNPFTEETTILFPDEQQNTDITITNLLGETLRSQFFSGRKLTIRRGELPCGSYILHIDDKKSVYSFKLIIE